NNRCPYLVHITHFIYLEVSTDGVNCSYISRTSAENAVLQPGDNFINGTFTNQSIDPSIQYYRIRAAIYPYVPCSTFKIYSPAYPLCGAGGTGTPNLTP